MLYDLTAIDERMRVHREGQPASDFTVVYHLLSFDRNEYIRIKVPLKREQPPIDTDVPISGRPRTGTNAKSGTCSAFVFAGPSASAAHPDAARPG